MKVAIISDVTTVSLVATDPQPERDALLRLLDAQPWAQSTEPLTVVHGGRAGREADIGAWAWGLRVRDRRGARAREVRVVRVPIDVRRDYPNAHLMHAHRLFETGPDLVIVSPAQGRTAAALMNLAREARVEVLCHEGNELRRWQPKGTRVA